MFKIYTDRLVTEVFITFRTHVPLVQRSIDNISLHLMLSIKVLFYPTNVSNARYSTTLAWWVIVKKVLKGKGINLFCGYKALAWENMANVSPTDYKINFVVPSDPVLAKEAAKLNIDSYGRCLMRDICGS